ncbi:hypothetical protein CGRA01v4_02432 [Colletotrichum graminicola]|nr:hypothetical protein CGRA01v4_02432 [Colletotrichum graminicola]
MLGSQESEYVTPPPHNPPRTRTPPLTPFLLSLPLRGLLRKGSQFAPNLQSPSLQLHVIDPRTITETLPPHTLD